MPKVIINLPNTVYSALRKDPEDFINEMRLAAAIKWYEIGEVSQDKAAEIAGISRGEFFTALARYKIDFIQLEKNDLMNELLNAQ